MSVLVDWRVWLFETLSTDGPLAALLPADSIYGAGSLTAPPARKPFLVIRMDPEERGPFPGVTNAGAVLYMHDQPGDYMAIDGALRAARVALCGADAQLGQPVGLPGGVAVVWQGDSGDLADPDYGTILRTSSFGLHGRDT